MLVMLCCVCCEWRDVLYCVAVLLCCSVSCVSLFCSILCCYPVYFCLALHQCFLKESCYVLEVLWWCYVAFRGVAFCYCGA